MMRSLRTPTVGLLALAIAVLVAAVLLSRRGGAPDDRPPGAGAAATASGGDARGGDRTAGFVQVTGRFVDQGRLAFYLAAPQGGILVSGTAAADGTFAVRARGPLVRAVVHTLEKGGVERELVRTRDAASGDQDWDLGPLELPVSVVEIGLEIAVEPDVLRSLLRSGGATARAELRREQQDGQVLGEVQFDLAACLADPAARQRSAKVATLDAKALSVCWSVHGPADDGMLPRGAFTETLHLAERRESRLPVTAAAAMRGVVQWRDGRPRAATPLRLRTLTGATLETVTDDDGSCCLLAGPQVRGTLQLLRPQAYPSPGFGVASGVSWTWLTDDEPMGFRVRAASVQPLPAGFTVAAGASCSWSAVGGLRRRRSTLDGVPAVGGVAFVDRRALAGHPSLLLDPGDGRLLVLPAAAWEEPAGADGIVDVDARQCLGTGELVVEGPADMGLGAGRRLAATLEMALGNGAVGIAIDTSAPFPWRIGGLPEGPYALRVGPERSEDRREYRAAVAAGGSATVRVERM